MSKLPTSCDRLMDGANDACVSFELLSEGETRAVVERVFDTHFPTRNRSRFYAGRGWIWASSKDAGSVSYRLSMSEAEEDWKEFKQLMAGWPAGSIFVFFEWHESKHGLRFESMGHLVDSVSESFILEDMYMTDAQSLGLACLNHHDYLILWGEAVDWVK